MFLGVLLCSFGPPGRRGWIGLEILARTHPATGPVGRVLTPRLGPPRVVEKHIAGPRDRQKKYSDAKTVPGKGRDTRGSTQVAVLASAFVG